MIAQIDISSRTVVDFLSAFSARVTHPKHADRRPFAIDPRAISLLDEHQYVGQHIHDSGNSSLADD
jgi:hypothetical protein